VHDGLQIVIRSSAVQKLLDLSKAIASCNETPEARLWALCYAHVRRAVANPQHFGPATVLPGLDTERFRTFRHQRRIIRAAYRLLIRAIPAPEVLSEKDSATRADLIWALIDGVIASPGELAHLDAETVSSQVADAALQSLGCPHGIVSTASAAAARLLARLQYSANPAKQGQSKLFASHRPGCRFTRS
jgi:hypothetical protein